MPLALALACGAALGAAAGPRLSVRAKPRVAQLNGKVAIRGRAGRSRGAVMALQRQAFPFDGNFETVARERTKRHGAYEFRRVPEHATRYRVVRAGSGASRAVTVYVEPRFSRLHCNLCGASSAHSGRHTLRISFRLLYPKDAFAREAGKRVLLYYGQRNGSAQPPRRLRLAGTARQVRSGPNRTRVAFEHRVRLPDTYRFAVAVCTRTSMRADGIGLPGAPGSHGCGDSAITYRQSRHWLG
jgi:hypothetical protein